MSYERKVIDLINSVMPQSPLRKSILGEVDSEVIILGDNEYLFTIDDFSREDLLQENDPFVLGWNVACGAISDIIAAGGKPLTYSHSMVIPQSWDKSYILKFSKGISELLQKYSVSFIGGDIGIADSWRYTAAVIGIPLGRCVNRIGCKAEDLIFITGKIGAGNLSAVLNLYPSNQNIKKKIKCVTNRFKSHEKLPGIISKYASSAIDTSDGVFSALKTITDLNRKGFNIYNLQFIDKGVLAANLLHLPALLLLLGECGEYEILFTVNKQNKESLLAELKSNKIEAYELGEITGNTHQKSVIYEDIHYYLDEYNIRARDYVNVTEYLKTMKDWIEKRNEC